MAKKQTFISKLGKDKKKFTERESNSSKWMGIGIAVGVACGVAMDNVGLGIALGVAIGAGMGSVQNKRKEKIKD